METPNQRQALEDVYRVLRKIAFKKACHSFARAAAPYLPIRDDARGLNKNHIAALSQRFQIDPGLFF